MATTRLDFSSGSSSRSDRHTRYLWCLAFWTMTVVIFNFRPMYNGQPLSYELAFRGSLARWCAWAFLSYFAIWLDDVLPIDHKSLARRFLAHLPLSMLFIGMYAYVFYWFRLLFDATPRAWALPEKEIWLNFALAFTKITNLIYWSTMALNIALRQSQHNRDQEMRSLSLERQLSDAKLQALQSQLHPHFLFNALNAISAYVVSAPRIACRMLEELGELLRLSLEHSDAQEITVEEEVAFLQRYLDLQRMRLEDRLTIKLNVEPSVRHALLPTFILQPLVENAIRHGITTHHSHGTIEVTAWRSNGNLHLAVRDDGPGLPAGWKLEDSSGIGLKNTRQRLRTMYGDNGNGFQVASSPGGGVRVELSLPYHSS